MKIDQLNTIPVYTIAYKKVMPKMLQVSGQHPLKDHFWPVLEGKATGLPKELDALLLASDLQGHIMHDGELKLLGEGLPEELTLLLEIEYPHIDPEKVGVILCGDLFALPHRRGGMGDVRVVWLKFREYFKWVAGVPGNHDMIGTDNSKIKVFKFERDIYYFENDNRKISDINIGGVGGIIGPTRKFNRWEAADFLKAIKGQLIKKPQIMLLHEGPDFPEDKFPGTPEVREILNSSPPSLVCFGHQHWAEPLRTLPNGTQLLNLEERTVLLLRS